ncbi:Asparagine--tRNA ligase [Dirofilaria immitis]
MGRVKQPKIISGCRYRGLRGEYGSLPTYTSPGRWIRYEPCSHTNNDGLLCHIVVTAIIVLKREVFLDLEVLAIANPYRSIIRKNP